MASNRLTQRKAERAAVGRHCDGNGLWLTVTATGARSWSLRYRLAGRDRALGLGALHSVTVERAREMAAEARGLVAQGVDPIDRRRADRAASSGATFQQAAEACHAAHSPSWSSERHAAEWIGSLRRHVIPALGDLPCAEIRSAHVIDALMPLWRRAPVTGERVRCRIEAVISFAAARGWSQGENPARWTGCLDAALPSPGRGAQATHHAAASPDRVPEIIAALDRAASRPARALAWVILTACRSEEACGATWAEIDTEARIWTIPADRAKGRRPHRVPLPPGLLARLGAPQAEDVPLFGCSGQALRDVAASVAPGVTVHGFRSTFRDWVAETGAADRDVAEAALAHKVRDRTEAAYRRGDLLDRRRDLMAAWLTYATGGSGLRRVA